MSDAAQMTQCQDCSATNVFSHRLHNRPPRFHAALEFNLDGFLCLVNSDETSLVLAYSYMRDWMTKGD